MAAEKKEIELEKAREELHKYKDEIKQGKPKNSDVSDSVAGILTASDQTEWHRKNVSSSVETNAMNRQSSTDAAAY